MEGHQRFQLTVEFIELNLPDNCLYLRFFVRDLSSQVKYVQEIPLNEPTKKFPLSELITFTAPQPSVFSNFEHLVGVCIVAVGEDYVAYVGTTIVNLKDAGEGSVRQNLVMCPGQKGYMVYRLDEQGKSAKPTQGAYVQSSIRQQKHSSISKGALQSFRQIPNCKSFEFKEGNSCDCSKQVEQLNYIIDEYKSKVIELVKENSALKESCHLEESTNARDQELAILNQKLLQKYEKALNENIELKMRYQGQLGEMKATIEKLQTVIHGQTSTKQEDVCRLDNFVLRQRLKNQQYASHLLETELEELRLQLEDIQSSLRHEQYARNFASNAEPKPAISRPIDPQRQIRVLLKINEYLKSAQLKQSLEDYFDRHNIDGGNYKEAVQLFFKNIKIEVRDSPDV